MPVLKTVDNRGDIISAARNLHATYTILKDTVAEYGSAVVPPTEWDKLRSDVLNILYQNGLDAVAEELKSDFADMVNWAECEL